jgi:DNA replicative helicase MCM subunit Mcm2 (Cdc46/Mcm family)
VQTNPPASSGATATEAEGEVIVLDGDTSAAATQPTQRIAQAPGHSGGSGVRREAPSSPQELAAIRALALSDHAFPLLVHSLCPTIYGHQLVKAGLLLGLFGGSSTQAQSGRRSGPTAAADDDVSAHSAKDFKVRPDIHVLVVGDPGLGKVGDALHIICEDICKCGCHAAYIATTYWRQYGCLVTSLLCYVVCRAKCCALQRRWRPGPCSSLATPPRRRGSRCLSRGTAAEAEKVLCLHGLNLTVWCNLYCGDLTAFCARFFLLGPRCSGVALLCVFLYVYLFFFRRRRLVHRSGGADPRRPRRVLH